MATRPDPVGPRFNQTVNPPSNPIAKSTPVTSDHFASSSIAPSHTSEFPPARPSMSFKNAPKFVKSCPFFPTYDPSHELNLFNAQLNFNEWGRIKNLLRLNTARAALRESAALKTDLLRCQLQMVLRLQKRTETPETVFDLFVKELMLVQENNIRNYEKLLREQTVYVEEGSEKPLTEEKKLELITKYTRLIEEQIQKAKAEMKLDPKVDLSSLQRALEETVQKNKAFMKELDDDFERNKDNSFIATHLKFLVEQKLIEIARCNIFYPPITDVWTAAERGSISFIERELSQFWLPNWISDKRIVYLNKRNADGYTALHIAAFRGQAEVVKLLLDNGADPHIEEDNPTIIMQNQKIVEKHPEFLPSGPPYYQPIHRACQTGSIPVVKTLLVHGVSLRARGECGRTPLHIAVFNSQYALVKFLLQQGADINAPSGLQEFCKTPLFDAVLHLDLEMVSILVTNKKLDLSLKDTKENTALYYALSIGHLEIIELLTGHPSYKKWARQDRLKEIEKVIEAKISHHDASVMDILQKLLSQAEQELANEKK